MSQAHTRQGSGVFNHVQHRRRSPRVSLGSGGPGASVGGASAGPVGGVGRCGCGHSTNLGAAQARVTSQPRAHGGPAEPRGPRASEAVGRVGDPVGRLLLGALGRAVGGEKGLVRLRLFAVRNAPLCGSTHRLLDFSRRAPVCCCNNEKSDSSGSELQVTSSTTLLKRKGVCSSGESAAASLGINVEARLPAPKDRRSYRTYIGHVEPHHDHGCCSALAQPRE